MKQYLIFNSSCEICSRIAMELEKEFDGWLEIKSLNDPSIRNYLNANYPGWSWKPMILLQDNKGKQKLLAGFKMKLFLAKNLGIYKTAKVIRLVTQFEAESSSSSHFNHHRRVFLRMSVPSFMGAIIAFKTPHFFKRSQTVDVTQIKPVLNPNDSDIGELYHGFILLPDNDSPIPSYVKQPQLYTRSVESFSNEEDLRKAVSFGLYKVSSKYSKLPLLNAQRSLIEDSGTTTGVTVNYGKLAYFSERLEVDRTISLIVQNETFYPFPYPIYPVHRFDSETDEISLVAPEKIRVGTAFGVLVPSSNGYVAHWIDKGILYTLAVEDATDRETMTQILGDLVEI